MDYLTAVGSIAGCCSVVGMPACNNRLWASALIALYMEAYTGIDLHSRNNCLGIINDNDKRRYLKRIPYDLIYGLMVIESFRDQLEKVWVNQFTVRYILVDK